MIRTKVLAVQFIFGSSMDLKLIHLTEAEDPLGNSTGFMLTSVQGDDLCESRHNHVCSHHVSIVHLGQTDRRTQCSKQEAIVRHKSILLCRE